MEDRTLNLGKDKILLRSYRPGDEHGICSLYEQVFQIPFRLEDWHWLYQKNPAGKAHVELALDGKQIVAHFAFFPNLMKLGKSVILGSKSFCAMTHPGYRGRGLFQAVTQRVLQEAERHQIPITYSTPNPNSYRIMVEVLEYQTISGRSGVPILVRPLNFISLIKSAPFFKNHVNAATVFKMIIPIFKKSYNSFYPIKKRNPSNSTVCELKTFDESIDDLWNRIKDQHSILTVRKATYLNWRYFARPNVQYRIWSAIENGKTQGYIVARNREMYGLNVGFIVDLFTIQDDDVVAELINTATKFFQDQGMDIIACLAQQHSFNFQILKRQGFFKIPVKIRPRDFHFVVHSNLSHFSQKLINDHRNWFLTWGDTEDG